MSFKEREGYYYEFALDYLFIPEDIINNYTRRALGASHACQRLGEFISVNIIKEGLQFSSDRVFLITQKQNKVIEVKNFCNFLMNNNILLDLTLTHILGKFNLEHYQLGLSNAYEKFCLNKSLNNELIEKPNNIKSRPKV